MGNLDLAEQHILLLQDIKEFGQEEYRRLGILFSAAGHKERAIQTIQEGVALYPDYPQFYTFLVDTYASIGENEKARQAVARAVELDPSLQQDAESFYQLLDQGALQN